MISSMSIGSNDRLIALFVLLLIPTVLGWGKEGHYVVCKITQVTLTLLLFTFPLPHTLNSTLILNSNPNFRSILVKMLFLQWNNCFQILLMAILLHFALGLMKFAIIIIGVVLYIMLIHLISCVIINTAVSFFGLNVSLCFTIYFNVCLLLQ